MTNKQSDKLICCYCGRPAQGNFAITRDGFGVGPEVPLCDAHGCDDEPTCDQIWRRIRLRRNEG